VHVPTAEEAALRRVATLVARESAPVEIFAAVTEEASRVLACEAVGLLRFEPDGTATLVAQSETPWEPPPLGTSFPLDGDNVVVEVVRTARAARLDDWADATGAVGAMATVLGVRSAVASPVAVGGRLWGTIIAATSQADPLPADTEPRIAQFTELVATAIANAEAREALARLAEEQAALRRVATLVADGAGPEGVFPGVAAEVDALFGADVSAIVRFEEDGSATVLGDVGGPHVSGKRVTLDPGYVVDRVRATNRPARFDTDDPSAEGMPSIVRGVGIRSAVASPIVVEGELWGAITAASVEGPLPSSVERRLTEFTELVASAISNTQARVAVEAAADEQAALRRVATLVATSAPPSEVFAAVTKEVALVLGADASLLCRADPDGSVVVVGTWADPAPAAPPGFRIPHGGTNLTTLVLDSGRPGRIDDYDEATGEAADVAHSQGVRSAVGVPILVEGRLWGLAIVGTSAEEPLPPDAEERLAAFTELVATAIANAESRQAVERAAAEQAALRRVATLVADQAEPGVIFASVAEEVGQVVAGERCAIGRFEGRDTLTVIAYWSQEEQKVPVGASFDVSSDEVVAAIRESGGLLRIDDHDAFSGPLMDYARTLGSLPSSTIAAPVFVGGRMWGIVFTSTMASALPEGAESRIMSFAELVATAISNAQARSEVQQLAEEQAALRRVATLVAVEAPQVEIFTAIAVGVAGAVGEELRLVRYDGEHALVVAASEGPHPDVLPLGTRLPVGGNNALSHVFRTGESIRIDDYSVATGPIAEAVRATGLRSIVATPVAVEGRTWGAMIVGAFGDEPVPPGTEDRLGQFAELIATSIANTEARAEIERLAGQEAALRRIATLVAEGVAPERVFAIVAEEAAATFGAIAIVVRFEEDPPASVVVGLSREIGIALGSRWPFEDGRAATEVFRSGRSARLSGVDWASQTGPFAEAALRAGVSSHVSSPILVEGRLWGVISLSASEELPPDTEQRLEKFTELVTTAIANAANRAELVASRARIVAAGDEARRRIERNLHDGTQQRLIALGLDLQRARAAIPGDERDTHAALQDVEDDLDAILEDLRELSHGLHPPLLSRLGLGPSLQALARRSPIPLHLDVDLRERPAPAVETAVYYVVSEAVTNAIKHSQAEEISVAISNDGRLRASIADDGVGGADPSGGSGLTGLLDRVDALGGRFTLESPPGGGTRMSVELPFVRNVAP
jgi:GAF domain-containing protein